MARKVLTSPADDYTVGLRVYWRRGLNVMKGYVTKVTYDVTHPAYVRSDSGRTYKPSFDTYCNDQGKLLYRPVAERRVVLSHGDPYQAAASLYDTLSKNRRAANARDKLPKPRAKLRKLMRSKSPWLGAPYESEQLLGASHVPAPFPPGVFAVGSLMGRHEYATGRGAHGARQWLTKVANYEVRRSRRRSGEWGIYTRDYNVCLATFAPNTAPYLREALRRMFDIAHITAEADARDARLMAAADKKGKRK